MSEKKQSTEDAAVKALADWADCVCASTPSGEAWDQMTDLERRIVSVVHNAAITLTLAREGLSDERDRLWLERLAGAKDDRDDPAKYVIGARIIQECAERSTPRLRDLAPEEAEHVDWAKLCVGMLSSEVHPGFGALYERVTEVKALLARYTNTKDRRGGKLTEAGILVELNALAAYPFKRSLSSHNITDALGRKKL